MNVFQSIVLILVIIFFTCASAEETERQGQDPGYGSDGRGGSYSPSRGGSGYEVWQILLIVVLAVFLLLVVPGLVILCIICNRKKEKAAGKIHKSDSHDTEAAAVRHSDRDRDNEKDRDEKDTHNHCHHHCGHDPDEMARQVAIASAFPGYYLCCYEPPNRRRY